MQVCAAINQIEQQNQAYILQSSPYPGEVAPLFIVFNFLKKLCRTGLTSILLLNILIAYLPSNMELILCVLDNGIISFYLFMQLTDFIWSIRFKFNWWFFSA